MTEAARRPSPASRASEGQGVPGDAVWLSAFAELATRCAHGLRNALNGVAVNLEVVRGRSQRGAEPAAIAPFAATAASQFEAASAAVEALLAFARPERGAPEPAGIVARLAALIAVVDGAELRVGAVGPTAGRTGVPPNVVRAVLARGVLSALAPPGAPIHSACEIAVGDDIFVRVMGSPESPPSLDPEVAALAAAHGVRVEARGRALELRFPILDSDATEP